MIVLGIETSCDETAVAIIEYKNSQKKVLANVINSQISLHQIYGGVVPELASRSHLEILDKLIRYIFCIIFYLYFIDTLKFEGVANLTL